MSKSILTIDFIVQEDQTLRVDVSQNKRLSKSDILEMLESFSTELRKAIKNEAN